VPQWGRPPGARLGRNRDGYGGYGAHQSWRGNDDERFQELPTEDEDGFLRPDPRYAYDEGGRFHSDELLFDGLEYSNTQHMRHRRSDDPYYEGSEYSENEDYHSDHPLRRQGSRQGMLIEKEEDLVARALERISRARALGKTDVKLTQPEIDALERLNRSKVQPKISPSPAKSLPASKKTTKPKAIEASKKKRSNSPLARPVEGRIRNKSNASTRSARDDRDDLVSYPLPQDPDYGYDGRAAEPRATPYQGSPLRPGGSRSNSSSNIRQVAGGQPMYAPYYQGQRYVSMPEGPYHRRGESNQSRVRADSAYSESRSRSGSNGNLQNIPLDSLPNPAHTSRAPRFDPSDPKYGSPNRRGVSGSSAGYGTPPAQPGIFRRQSDEMYLADDTEVLSYMVSNSGASRSNSDSDRSYHESERPLEVNVQEKPGTKTGYAIKTRSAAAASGSKIPGKPNPKASIRRR